MGSDRLLESELEASHYFGRVCQALGRIYRATLPKGSIRTIGASEIERICRELDVAHVLAGAEKR